MVAPVWSIAPMKAEGPAASLRGHDRGQHRVAGRAAHPLAEAIGETHGQDLQGSGRESHQRAGEGREAVTRDHERLATRGPVGEPPGHELEQAGQGLGRALDETEEGWTRLQHAREEPTAAAGRSSRCSRR